jgi:cytochrome c
MRKHSFFIAALMATTLAACGSPAEEPTEQIIVRKPGEAAATSVATAPADLVSKGRNAFAACVACHAITAGEASGSGPNLNGVVGRAAASVKDFGYSKALQSSGISWTETELDGFLKNPATKVPGTSMAVAGNDDAEERKAIIAYLTSLSK